MFSFGRQPTSFTSKQAVDLFKQHTGFEFHPTVPGQLLARCGVKKLPTNSKPARFSSEHWPLAWEQMFYLALRRCRFRPDLQPPRKCFAPSLTIAEHQESTVSPPSPGSRDADHTLCLKPHPTRKFIDVPFREKDEAKALGAKWCTTLRKWYVPSGLDRALFRWDDLLMPPEMRAVKFPVDKQRKPKTQRKKRKTASGSSAAALYRIQAEMDTRLDHLLDKPD